MRPSCSRTCACRAHDCETSACNRRDLRDLDERTSIEIDAYMADERDAWDSTVPCAGTKSQEVRTNSRVRTSSDLCFVSRKATRWRKSTFSDFNVCFHAFRKVVSRAFLVLVEIARRGAFIRSKHLNGRLQPPGVAFSSIHSSSAPPRLLISILHRLCDRSTAEPTDDPSVGGNAERLAFG